MTRLGTVFLHARLQRSSGKNLLKQPHLANETSNFLPAIKLAHNPAKAHPNTGVRLRTVRMGPRPSITQARDSGDEMSRTLISATVKAR